MSHCLLPKVWVYKLCTDAIHQGVRVLPGNRAHGTEDAGRRDTLYYSPPRLQCSVPEHLRAGDGVLSVPTTVWAANR